VPPWLGKRTVAASTLLVVGALVVSWLFGLAYGGGKLTAWAELKGFPERAERFAGADGGFTEPLRRIHRVADELRDPG
jgi:hypothetical protein